MISQGGKEGPFYFVQNEPGAQPSVGLITTTAQAVVSTGPFPGPCLWGRTGGRFTFYRGTVSDQSLSVFQIQVFLLCFVFLPCGLIIGWQSPNKLSPGRLIAARPEIVRHLHTFVLWMFLLRDARYLEFCPFLGVLWLGAALLNHGSGV